MVDIVRTRGNNVVFSVRHRAVEKYDTLIGNIMRLD